MKHFALSIAAVILATGCTASAQTLISDNFNTNPTNPNDVSWYSSAGTVTTFSGSTGALQFTQGDASNNVSVFKQFTPTTLAVGQTLQLSFTYTGFTSQPTSVSNSHFRIGLFDTSNTFTANQGLTPGAPPTRATPWPSAPATPPPRPTSSTAAATRASSARPPLPPHLALPTPFN